MRAARADHKVVDGVDAGGFGTGQVADAARTLIFFFLAVSENISSEK